MISVPIARRLGLGSVLGYLLAGVAVGPFALGFVGGEGQDVLHFAEFGVVMMLFLIGLELSPSELWRLRGVLLGFHADVDRRSLGRGLEAIVAVRIRPHSRQYVDAFWGLALELPEVVQVFHVTGADDFLLHIAVADTDALRDFVLDRLTVRPEVGHVESRVVYAQGRRPALEPLDR